MGGVENEVKFGGFCGCLVDVLVVIVYLCENVENLNL